MPIYNKKRFGEQRGLSVSPSLTRLTSERLIPLFSHIAKRQKEYTLWKVVSSSSKGSAMTSGVEVAVMAERTAASLEWSGS